jgi:hypothetical protein
MTRTVYVAGRGHVKTTAEALERFEAKLDAHLGKEVPASAGTSTPTPVDAALERLARNLGDDTWTLPACCVINRGMDDEGMFATGFTVDGVYFPLKLAFELNIVALDGRIDYYRLGPILHALKGGSPFTQPARRPRL